MCEPMLQPLAITAARTLQTRSDDGSCRWDCGMKLRVNPRSLSTSMSKSGRRMRLMFAESHDLSRASSAAPSAHGLLGADDLP